MQADEHVPAAHDHGPRPRRDVLPDRLGAVPDLRPDGRPELRARCLPDGHGVRPLVHRVEARRCAGAAAVPDRRARRADRRHGVRGARRARADPAALRPAHRAGARHRRARAGRDGPGDGDLGERCAGRRGAGVDRPDHHHLRRPHPERPLARDRDGDRRPLRARGVPAPDALRADRPRGRREPRHGDRARDRRAQVVHARLCDRRPRRRNRRRPLHALLRRPSIRSRGRRSSSSPSSSS